jgi:hypothetical protein
MLGTIALAAAAAAFIIGGGRLVSASYIPPKNADLVNWVTNFDTLITANPATYGLVAGDATAIHNAVQPFLDAYALGGGTYHDPVSPTTRTPVTVAAMQNAKTAMLAVIRPYAQQIAINPGVTSDDKIALGLNPRQNTPVPISAPTSYPGLQIIGAQPLNITLKYQDSAMGTGKAKAPGAIQLQIFAKTSETAITDPTALPLIQIATKAPFNIAWGSGDGGKQAYIAARYITRRGLTGPWSPIISMTVPMAP